MSNNYRTGMRISLGVPVDVRWKSRSGTFHRVEGKIGNISGNGLFMNVPVRPPRNTPVTIKVLLPPTVTRIPIELLCNGRVVRWNRPGEPTGMGATIDEYELRPARTPRV